MLFLPVNGGNLSGFFFRIFRNEVYVDFKFLMNYILQGVFVFFKGEKNGRSEKKQRPQR